MVGKVIANIQSKFTVAYARTHLYAYKRISCGILHGQHYPRIVETIQLIARSCQTSTSVSSTVAKSPDGFKEGQCKFLLFSIEDTSLNNLQQLTYEQTQLCIAWSC